MNAQRAARWSGSGICNGRLRLAVPNARYYSPQAHRLSSRPAVQARCLKKAPPTFIIQQIRSISLFGWGGSSTTSKPGEFASEHAPIGTPADKVFVDPVSSIEQIRVVKAYPATSDAPDPSTSISTSLSHTPEPAVLKHFEDVIADPGGHAPEVANTVAQVAEYKGYLKEVCGLDYGWGPTATLQNVLETMHITFGQSWAVSIVSLAVVYRIIVAIFVYRSADQGTIMKNTMPMIKPIVDEIGKAKRAGDMAKQAQLTAEMQALKKESGVNFVALILPLAIQLPFGFAAFRLLRGCANAPVPAFVDESWLWTVDLTTTDPYYVLPVVQGLLMYQAMRLSRKAGIQLLEGPMGPYIMIGLPALSVVWSTFQPGSVQLFFVTSTAIASLQGWALTKNGFRKAIGLMAIPGTSPTAPPAGPSSGTLRRMPRGGTVIDIKPSPKAALKADPSQRRSFIDKMVDSAKARKEGLSFSTPEAREQKQREREETDAFRKAEKHEFIRREELQHEREVRTRAQQQKHQEQTSTGPGGLRTMKKERSKK